MGSGLWGLTLFKIQKMAKKILRPKRVNKCKDCFHCVPDMSRLTNAKEGEEPQPILGGCKYERCKFLLSDHDCSNFLTKS